jgi:hypothetical protein
MRRAARRCRTATRLGSREPRRGAPPGLRVCPCVWPPRRVAPGLLGARAPWLGNTLVSHGAHPPWGPRRRSAQEPRQGPACPLPGLEPRPGSATSAPRAESWWRARPNPLSSVCPGSPWCARPRVTVDRVPRAMVVKPRPRRAVQHICRAGLRRSPTPSSQPVVAATATDRIEGH